MTADQAFTHWLRRQGEMWQESGPTATPPVIQPFRTLDLSREWTTATFDTPAALDAFRPLPAAQQDKQFAPTPLVLYKDAYLPVGADRRALYRRHVTLTPGWLRNARQHLIMVAQWPRNGLPGGGELWLNGAKVTDLTTVPFQGLQVDLTAALRPGDNLLEILAKGSADNGGFAATVMLRRTVAPRRVINLAGDWHGQVSEDQQITVPLPGKFEGVYAYADLPVPADLAGKEVWVYADSADSNSTAWISTNGRVRYMSYFGSRSENGRPLQVNITPDLRPGETNRFLLGTQTYAQGNWKTVKHDYRALELWVYNPGDWQVKD